MFEVYKEAEFSAAHFLRDYEGKCESLHGHNWKVRLLIKALQLDSIGMVMDFEEIKGVLENILTKLDHHNLNEIPPFDRINPTSENVARYIFEEASQLINTENTRVSSVQVWEKQASCAIYKAD